MSVTAWQVQFNKRRDPDDMRWNSTAVEFWPTLRAALRSTQNCVTELCYRTFAALRWYNVRPCWSRYNWTNTATFGHTGVVTLGQTVLRSVMMESLQLDKQYYVRSCWSRYSWTNNTTFGRAGVVTIGQTVLRSVMLESLQLDKNGEAIRHDFESFSMQISRPNHTSLFRLEPKCHRSGWPDLSRTADDCGVAADGREPDYRK
jgi:hypothetical protein